MGSSVFVHLPTFAMPQSGGKSNGRWTKQAGQIAKAAALLAISRTTLWEKMTRLGLVDRVRSDS